MIDDVIVLDYLSSNISCNDCPLRTLCDHMTECGNTCYQVWKSFLKGESKAVKFEITYTEVIE